MISSNNNKKVLIGAGGTGGHVYPALAVAKELRILGMEIEWIGTKAGIESRLVPDNDIILHTIFIQGIRGNGIKRLLKAPFTLCSAIYQSRKVIKNICPDIFLGFGGFASGPAAIAAKLLGVPVLLHEQNAVMGLTNRLVSRWAKKVLLAFPIDNNNGEAIGNPIRADIANLPPPRKRIRDKYPFRVLVLGGSLGAKPINDIIPSALAPLLPQIKLTHQTGELTFNDTLVKYKNMGILDKVNIIKYIDNIADVYAQTDLLISRSGALTVSEVASVGLPAIFIPLPHAVDNHQFLNANFLTQAKAAIIIEQKDLTTKSLGNTVKSLLDGRRLLSMAENAKKCSHENALTVIVKRIQEIVND